MNIKHIPKEKRLLVIILLLIPLIISISLLVYLKLSWQYETETGEKLSPIENPPLFIALILFTVGYLFFLGMLFSDSMLELLNKRKHALKR